MRTPLKGIVLVLVAATLGSATVAQERDVVADTIAARQALMASLEELLGDLEANLAAGTPDATQVLVSANAIGAQLDAFALLFPAESNLLGSGNTIEGVTTSAAPAIWDNREDFGTRAAAAAELAREVAVMQPHVGLPRLRQTCSGCHETYLHYDPFAAMGIGSP